MILCFFRPWRDVAGIAFSFHRIVCEITDENPNFSHFPRCLAAQGAAADITGFLFKQLSKEARLRFLRIFLTAFAVTLPF